MSLVLEMPAIGLADDLLADSPSPTLAESPAADSPATPATAAADLLDTPTADDGDGRDFDEMLSDHGDLEGVVGEVLGNEESPAAEPEKPKRKRKPKDAAAEESLPATDPTVAAAATKHADDLTAKTETSRATRKMQIATVTADYVEVSLAIQENEDQIESCKAELKHLHEKAGRLASELRSLRNDEVWQPRLPNATPPAGAADQEPTPAGSLDDPSLGSSRPAASANGSGDAWRSVPLSALNLPPKLTETLIEANAATIGQLEDLRGQISQAKAVWPKGIGVAKQTLIEDAVIAWLTANRDRAVFEEIHPAAVAGANDAVEATPVVECPPGDAVQAAESPAVAADPIAEPAATDPPTDKPAKAKRGRKKKEKDTPLLVDPPATAAAPSKSSPPQAIDDSITLAEWEGFSNEQQLAWINSRAAFINDGSEDCLSQKMQSDRFWKSGYEGNGRGMTLADCPYIPGPEADDWIRGLLAAKALENFPDSEEAEKSTTLAPASPSPAKPPKATPKAKAVQPPAAQSPPAKPVAPAIPELSSLDDL